MAVVVVLDAAYRKLAGAGGRLFADPQPSPDEVAFQVDNTSAAYYESAYYKLHKKDLQPVPPPRVAEPRVNLADILEPDSLAAITEAARISFHAVGDTGAAKVSAFQTAEQALANEASVADAMARDVQAGGPPWAGGAACVPWRGAAASRGSPSFVA